MTDTYIVNLLGSFRLSAPNGERIEIASKKGVALIAMLAIAPDGERTRGWLQDRLWGSRQLAQAQGSLRRELSALRDCINRFGDDLITSNTRWVRLELGRCNIDARHLLQAGSTDALSRFGKGEFLEGLDIAGEDGFEDWVREMRCLLETSSAGALPSVQPAEPAIRAVLPNAGVHVAPPGFSDRPALAILRFANRSGDASLDYLAEGISEDLIDSMSRLRWLPVIARSSSFALADSGIDAKRVGQMLGARYVLDGLLRKIDEGSVIATALIDAESGFILWSHRIPLGANSSQRVLDQIAEGLVGRLDALIDHAEQLRAIRTPPESALVRDLIWRGRWHLNRLNLADADRARALFELALEREPNSAEALIQTTLCLGWSIWLGRRPPADILAMCKLAHRAILADKDDGRAHMLAGIAELWLRRPQSAEEKLRTAVVLSPSLAQAHANLGSTCNLSGRPENAFGPLQTAIRLSPNDVHIFYPLGELAMANLMLGKWDEALNDAGHALLQRNSYWYAHVIKINALWRSGAASAAEAAAKALLEAVPDFSPSRIGWVPFADSSWNDFLCEGLRAACSMHSDVAMFDGTGGDDNPKQRNAL